MRQAPHTQTVIALGAIGPVQEPKLSDQWLEMTGAAMSTTVFGWLMLNNAPLWTKVLAIGSAGLRVKAIYGTYTAQKNAWNEQQASAARYLAENPDVAAPTRA